MKKSNKKVCVFGSGPIVIGQACEFDYSGVQACKALMEKGFEVILINSNPATIMTDSESADRVYIEPLTPQFVEKILEKERPHFVIPTLGGQTALNLALELDKKGVFEKWGIQLLGASAEIIRRAEDREKFREILKSIGARFPKSVLVHSFKEGMEQAQILEFPLILRPNYTLGGSGGGIVHSAEEMESKLAVALRESPTSEVLIEQSLLGWKEYELEVMRDKTGTFVVICSIENVDPCGVHTGDSIAVAPQQTLSEKEYQDMRTEGKKIISAVGVETGGANIQFAVHPVTRERLVIEMNPRVSRSSALASKATGFPIAKIAALLAMGFTLDEIQNDITQSTPSCYEPALDYIVTKVPRFDFDKFEGAQDVLSTQMQSVGEVMGIGRTFLESLMKSLWSIEKNRDVLFQAPFSEEKLTYPHSQRFFYIFQAFREGMSIQQVHDWTGVDSWFLDHISSFIQMEKQLQNEKKLSKEILWKAKKMGFPDEWIGRVKKLSAQNIQKMRWKQDILPAFYSVDTCAGEFRSQTPYYYSTYWGKRTACLRSHQKSVLIFGSGPNRIGQGIEFDYSCVRGIKKLKSAGFHTIMINSNPETVSTDYDTSDELYFEPLSEEYILEVLRYTQPWSFCAQFGGQTSLNLAKCAVEQGFKMLGSSMKVIDQAEDRMQFARLCSRSGFKVPMAQTASCFEEAIQIVQRIGYPLICRPSYVLGGRRMEIIENEGELKNYFKRYRNFISPSNPCLVDQFLENYLEVDVDMVRGKNWSMIGGILEHIEATGIHSGDSMGVTPPQRLKKYMYDEIEKCARLVADQLGVLGLLNLQLAVKNDEIFILEANPRSSRSIPFLSKANAIPIVDIAITAMLGEDCPEIYDWKNIKNVCVKGVVFPFKKFNDVDSILGPEMKSIGEVMGRGEEYSEAMLKALVSSHFTFPLKGEVFLSLKDKDKADLINEIKELVDMGYCLSATRGTAKFLNQQGISCLEVKKVHEGRPHCVDRIRSGKVAFVFNTTSGQRSIQASFGIRRSCVDHAVPCITEKQAICSFLMALKQHQRGDFEVSPIQKNTFTDSLISSLPLVKKERIQSPRV